MNSITKYFLRNKKFKHNSISYYGQFFCNFIIQIIFPPAMIFIWDVNTFGIIIYLLSIPSFLSILVLNFATGSRQEMIQAKIKKKKTYLNSLYSNFIFITLISYVIYFLVSLLFIKYFNFNKLENFVSQKDINFILYLVFASNFIKIFETIYSTKISYYGKFYIQKYMDIIFETTLKISMLVVGLFTNLLTILFIVYFLISLLKIIIYIYLGIKNSEIRFNYKDINLNQIFFISKKSTQYIFINFDELIKNSLMPIIIGLFFDFRMVSFFTTLKTMFYFFPKRFFEVVIEILQFDYLKLYYEKKTSLLKKIFIRQNIFTFIFLIFFLIFSSLIGKKIYNLWTNYEYEILLKNFFIFLIIFDCFFVSIGISMISILKSFNKAHFLAVSSFFFHTCACLMGYFMYQIGFKFETLFILSLSSSICVFFVALFSLKNTYNYIKK
ncbi:hypothetical protein IDH19_00735 [Pelagibacterales bacterium SAG-MED48]|nr:hypothetical protein [Pelagibacterales bacterium SAG-MED48]